MAGLNIKLKDTQWIARKRIEASKPISPTGSAKWDTIYYWGTVRGAGLWQESNDNAILNDRGVQQIASPTQKGRTATQWRAAPSYVADRLWQWTYSWDNRYNQITRPTKLGIEDQIKQNNQGIINPQTPTDIPGIETPTTPTDEMYQGAFGVKKPTKGENMLAEAQAKKLEQEQKLRDEQNNLSIIEQTEYLKKSKEQQDYMEQQRALQEEQEKINEEQTKVQEDAQLKEASDSISRIRQNLGFIGGSNSVSQQALDSAGRQISNMSKMYADMKQLNELGGRARGVQSESIKNNFNRDMKLLQDDLDTKVDKVIQGAFNGIAAADMSGKLDTIEEVNAMRLKVLNAIDLDVAAVTKGEIQRREMLLWEYTQLLADEKERIKLSNTVNPEMSAMRGYYVDGNGEAFVDASTGLPIPMPVEAPYPPQFLKETGQLLTFWYDENWQIVANVQQVVDMPTQASDKTIKITNADWVEETYQFNVATGKYDIPVGNAQTLPWDTPMINAINQAVLNIKTGAQCGKFVNDVLQNAGYERLIGDSYESKVKAIQTIGEATQESDIWVGSMFTYAVDGSTNWHIGLVTGINGDGTINVMDYNYNGDEWQRVESVNIAEIMNRGGYVSKPIITWQTQGDTQQFSEAQVRQFKSYNGNSIPEEYKTAQQKQKFLDNYSQREQQNPTNLNKEDRVEVQKTIDNLATDPSYKAYETIKSKINSFTKIVTALENGTATAQDKQAFISDFAKVLDPTSVVREGEYAIAANYSQSKIDKMKQEVYNFFNTGWPLSDDAALLLSKGLARQYDSLWQAHDDAIDAKLKWVNYTLQKEIPVEALQTSYSHKKVNPLQENTTSQWDTTQTWANQAETVDPLGINW